MHSCLIKNLQHWQQKLLELKQCQNQPYWNYSIKVILTFTSSMIIMSKCFSNEVCTCIVAHTVSGQGMCILYCIIYMQLSGYTHVQAGQSLHSKITEETFSHSNSNLGSLISWAALFSSHLYCCFNSYNNVPQEAQGNESITWIRSLAPLGEQHPDRKISFYIHMY